MSDENKPNLAKDLIKKYQLRKIEYDLIKEEFTKNFKFRIENITKERSLARQLLHVDYIPDGMLARYEKKNTQVRLLCHGSKDKNGNVIYNFDSLLIEGSDFLIPTYTHSRILDKEITSYEEASDLENKMIIQAIDAAVISDNIVNSIDVSWDDSQDGNLTVIISSLFSKVEKNKMVVFNLVINPKTFFKYKLDESEALVGSSYLNSCSYWTAKIHLTNLVSEEVVYATGPGEFVGVMPIRDSTSTNSHYETNSFGIAIVYPQNISKVNISEVLKLAPKIAA